MDLDLIKEDIQSILALLMRALPPLALAREHSDISQPLFFS